jgi:hypothetical protein
LFKSIKLKISSSKPKYWCTIMYACEKSLAPQELSYFGLFNFAHSSFFHVIVIFKSSHQKCLSFYSSFWNSNCEWTLHKKISLKYPPSCIKCGQMLKMIKLWWYFVYIVYVTCIRLVLLFELVIITYIYWLIECPSRVFFMGVFELARIGVCLLTIQVHSKNSFNMGVFKFARISPTSIGSLNATQKLHLLVHAFKVDQK